MTKKGPSMAAQQRAFRAKHKPEQPPYVGIWLREGDALCLAAGVIPDSLRQTVRDMEKSNLAQLAGWTYLQFTPRQLQSGDAMPLIAQVLR